MASEDSRYRDRRLRFIDSVIEAMRRSPTSCKCPPASIMRRDDGELLEVGTLSGSQWALFEEQHY
jgi:hypothetical protein